MRMRVVAIAAAVILVAAFVVAAVPCGAVLPVYESMWDSLSSQSLLSYGNKAGTVRNNASLYSGAWVGRYADGHDIVVWVALPTYVTETATATLGMSGQSYYPMYDMADLLTVRVGGSDWRIQAITFTADGWGAFLDQYAIAGEPNYISYRLQHAVVESPYICGCNYLDDFMEVMYNQGMARPSSGDFLGPYQNATFSVALNATNGQQYIKDFVPVYKDGQLQVAAGVEAALGSVYADTGMSPDPSNFPTYSVSVAFGDPFVMDSFPIKTFGGVDVTAHIYSAIGTPYALYAVTDDDGWQTWNNSDINRLTDMYTLVFTCDLTYESVYMESIYVSTSAYDSGYTDGYESGYGAGTAAGEEAGYVDGKQDGMQEGFDSGYSQGVGTGKELGYSIGYSEGLQVAENGNFYSLISAVVDAPIQAFLGLLTFEFLGVNLANFFLSIVSAFFALKIYKIVKSV